jgi:hypothetical protein
MSHNTMALPSEVDQYEGLPYLVFCIDSYLPPIIAEELNSTFPEALMRARLGERFAANVDLLEKSPELIKFLDENQTWNEYAKYWHSKELLIKLIELFSPSWNKRWHPLWKPLMVFRCSRLKNLEVTTHLSVYRTGFRLTPHSDDKFKLLSLIHYLPEQESEEPSSAGTTFFSPLSSIRIRRKDLRQFSEWSRGLRRHLPLWTAPSIEASLARRYSETDTLDATERTNFERYFIRFKHIDYKTNRITGFVKNDWSMHEVDLTDFPENQLRRAVLINVRLKPTRLSRLIPRLEKLYLQFRS